MKKMVKMYILSLSIIFVYSIVFSLTEVQAAEKTMYVKAKSDIILREKPHKDSKKIGTIKNHSSVMVSSTSNGWSFVNTGKKKGYVYSNALVNENPKATKIQNVAKGLSPKKGLTLTYSPSILDDKKETFKVVYENGEVHLKDIHGIRFIYSELERGIAIVEYPSGHELFNATYPMIEGKNSKENFEVGTESGFDIKQRNILIESTSKTVKVKAGTFKNVVVTKDVLGFRNYLAPGIGIIKTTDKDGKVITELISIK